MDTGFGQNLEGFLIKGNLSLSPSEVPYLQGDGSIEGAGTLYINYIKEYNSTQGIDIQDVKFINSQIIIPYDVPSSNSTTGALILQNGGLSINQTRNSLSITEGGALTIAGGASIAKNLNLGGILNVNNHSIINVPLPLIGTDAVNKDYVDSVADKLSGNFTTGQIIIADSIGDAIRGFDSFTFTNGELLRLDSPFIITNTQPIINSTTASFVVYGGVSIGDDTVINGTLDLSGNNIINIAEPLESSDAATKYYVDSKTYGNLLGNLSLHQVVVGSTSSNFLDSYPQFTFNGSNLVLGTAANFIINNTQEPYAFGDTNYSFLTYGGAIINKNLIVGGIIDVNGNNIINVAEPIDDSDAATKFYVDNAKIGGIFTTGQLIIADSNGDAIRGYDNLTWSFDGTRGTLNLFPYSQIFIHDSTNSTGLGTGGTFTTLGGGSFGGDLWIGGKLDVNLNNIKSVATPIEDYDAVNKAYVDALISSLTGTSGNLGNLATEQSFVLDNNISSPEDVLNFYYDSDTKAFISQVYIQNTGTNRYALYTLRGNKIDGSNWSLTTTIIGQPVGVKFSIREAGDIVVLQYINPNLTGRTTIRFRTTNLLKDEASIFQTNYTLGNNIISSDIPGLSFINSLIHAAKIIIYVSDDTGSRYGIYYLNCLLIDNNWISYPYKTGNLDGLDFWIVNDGSIGKVKYSNTNLIGDFNIRFTTIKIFKAQTETTLYANTVTDTVINHPQLVFNQNSNFQLTAYVEVPALNKYTLYEIEGVLVGNKWQIHSKWIGDNNNIKFSIGSSNSVGYLKYTNTNNVDGIIKFIVNTAITFKPLNVDGGGTGNSFLEPYAVLRGNGEEPIVASDDFIYKDLQLILGNRSSIILKNTDYATNLSSGGSFTSYGGMSISKNLIVGEWLDLTGNNIINVAEPIEPSDAATKYYVDSVANKLTGNFTTGQIIVADSVGDAIHGFDNLTWSYNGTIGSLNLLDHSQIYIYDTTNSVGLGSGGTFTTLGGASFQKDVWVGGKLDVNLQNIKNVATPLVDYDAVNKAYVDAAINNAINLSTSGNLGEAGFEQTFVLGNNTSDDVNKFSFSTDIRSFVSYVYVESTSNKYAFYTLRGTNRLNGDWELHSSYIGVPTGVTFNLRESAGKVYVGYTNSNTTGTTTIRFRTVNIINTQPNSTQTNIDILNNVTDIPISSLTLLNSLVRASKIVVYISDDTNTRFGVYYLTCVLTGGIWQLNYYNTGNVNGVTFKMVNESNTGKIYYSNTNTTGSYMLRYTQTKIFDSQAEYTLYANTLVPTDLGNNQFEFSTMVTFTLTLYVEIPTQNRSALYEIDGFIDGSIWKINSRWVGSDLGIKFSISTSGGVGYLEYINPNGNDAIIKFLSNVPSTFQPLPVKEGGTGNVFLNPYAVLRGNGEAPIIGTPDFIYENYTLKLAEESSLLIRNTTPATNLTTGGTITTYGGVAVGKNLIVGTELTVNNIDITPSLGDITKEQSFLANNNVNIPEDVVGFSFTNVNIKSFSGMICITVTKNDNSTTEALYEVRGLRKSTGWIINTSYNIGDILGIAFSITNSGQVQYTSENISDWNSTIMKFRALTTTI